MKKNFGISSVEYIAFTRAHLNKLIESAPSVSNVKFVSVAPHVENRWLVGALGEEFLYKLKALVKLGVMVDRGIEAVKVFLHVKAII